MTKPREVPQFDHPCGDRILGGQIGKSGVEGEDGIDFGIGRRIRKLNPSPTTSVLYGFLPSRRVHQDPTHGLGGGGEEVSTAFELLVADEPEVRFVDQRGGVEGMAGCFGRHARSGERPQLVVNEREQVGRSLAITFAGGFDQASHIGHDCECIRGLNADKVKAMTKCLAEKL